MKNTMRDWDGIVQEAIWSIEMEAHDSARATWARLVLLTLARIGNYWLEQEQAGDVRPEDCSAILSLDYVLSREPGGQSYRHTLPKDHVNAYREKSRKEFAVSGEPDTWYRPDHA